MRDTSESDDAAEEDSSDKDSPEEDSSEEDSSEEDDADDDSCREVIDERDGLLTERAEWVVDRLHMLHTIDLGREARDAMGRRLEMANRRLDVVNRRLDMAQAGARGLRADAEIANARMRDLQPAARDLQILQIAWQTMQDENCDLRNERNERARERAREATFEAERKAFALQQRKELASKQPKSRLSPHSSVAKAQWAREEIARLQALDQLQHEPTIRALRIAMRMYPTETAHDHSKRLGLAINWLREQKLAHESNVSTLRQMERERAALICPRLSASETLSVQQMHRAMHRP